MDKRVIIYPAATLATAAFVTIASYNANRADTKVAAPLEDPNALVRTEPAQMHPFDLYGQGEDFQYAADFMTDRIGRSKNQEEIDNLWHKIAEAKKGALKAYTDAIEADSNSSYANLARARIMGLKADAVFQEANAGDMLPAGHYMFRVTEKKARQRLAVDGKEGYTTAAVGVDLYEEGQLVGSGYFELSPRDRTIGEMIESIKK